MLYDIQSSYKALSHSHRFEYCILVVSACYRLYSLLAILLSSEHTPCSVCKDQVSGEEQWGEGKMDREKAVKKN